MKINELKAGDYVAFRLPNESTSLFGNVKEIATGTNTWALIEVGQYLVKIDDTADITKIDKEEE